MRCISGAAPDIVFVLPPPCGIICGGGILPDEDVIVAVRPAGGAAPKMLEKAASRCGLLDDGPYRRWSY